MYLAYWYQPGLEEAWVNDNPAPYRAATAALTGPLNITVGLAREREARTTIQLALVIDRSLSMKDDWAALKNGTQRAIEELNDTNLELALIEFVSTPNNATICSPIGDCSAIARIWSYFTTDYQRIMEYMDYLGNHTLCCYEWVTDALLRALHDLNWSNMPTVVKAILVAGDEPIQGSVPWWEVTQEDNKYYHIPIYVARVTNSDFDLFAEHTGGKVFVLGEDFDLGDALLELLHINMKPSNLSTEVFFVGAYSGRNITVEGVAPGDRVIIAGVYHSYSLTVNGTRFSIDLTRYFTAREIAETLMRGGFKVIVVLNPMRALLALPSEALLHVVSSDGSVNTWVPVRLRTVSTCVLRANVSGPVLVEPLGNGYYLVNVSSGSLGAYPAVELTLPLGAEVRLTTSSGVVTGYVGGGGLLDTPAMPGSRLQLAGNVSLVTAWGARSLPVEPTLVEVVPAPGTRVLVEARLAR